MTNSSIASSVDTAYITVPSVTTSSVTAWVEAYVHAWQTNAPVDIAALFTADAEYHETPYETDWIGRDEIVDGWRSRWNWQKGGWDFEWTIASIDGATAVVTGIGHYRKLGDFDNVWTVAFDQSGRCGRFEMLNTERG
jgi:hypothetical protein